MGHAATQDRSTAPVENWDRMMTPAEARATFENAAKRYLGMGGDEFLRKWRSGFFKGKRELSPRVDAVSILLPLIER